MGESRRALQEAESGYSMRAAAILEILNHQGIRSRKGAGWNESFFMWM